MFFNPYLISSVALSSIGANYLFDVNRNNKNEVFYKEKENSFKKDTKETLENVKQIFQTDV